MPLNKCYTKDIQLCYNALISGGSNKSRSLACSLSQFCAASTAFVDVMTATRPEIELCGR